MADRFFPNTMPDFIPEASAIAEAAPQAGDSLTRLLYLPYKSICQILKKSALDLKDTVVRETSIATGKRVQDYTLYTGTLGTAFLLFKAYQVTKNKADLALSSEIIKACDYASRGSSKVTFLCGRSGVCALGAVVAKAVGDERLVDHYLAEFGKVPFLIYIFMRVFKAGAGISFQRIFLLVFKQIELSDDLPYELLYGRAGFLWSCLFLNKHFGKGTVSSSTMRGIVTEVIQAGRRLGKGRCPLMYEWHGKRYWGAAHGLAGIMHVLMDMELKPDEQEDVKATLRYMIKGRFPSGNYPSSEGSETDRLVHWCHGAPGVALTLAKAAQVYGDKEFLQAAMDAGEVVWKRGLLKRVGICHGISGNTYVFLTLHRLTGNALYLYRAKAFASFLEGRALRLIDEGVMHGGDRPFSLFEGVGGMAFLLLDMQDPTQARFPAYEL